MIHDIQRALADVIQQAAHQAVAQGRLPEAVLDALHALGDTHVEVPRDSGKGDFAATAALRLAGPAKLPPRRVAEELVAALSEMQPVRTLPVDRVEVAGPGFINFFLTPGWLNPIVSHIRARGAGFGRSSPGAGRRVQVEFVSANPTGPLGVVNARAAAVGDTLAALLEAAGHLVEREYYVNDAGGQVRRLGLSVEARWLELQGVAAEVPEGGYRGDYVIDIARAYDEARGDWARAHGGLEPFRQPEPAGDETHPGEANPAGDHDAGTGLAVSERVADMARFAMDLTVASHRDRLAEYGVHFDVWFSQHQMMQTDALDRALKALEARGHVFRHDNAVWLQTTAFGDDRDRVLVRSNGEPTYFLADIAYHLDKFNRGFDQVIDIWGPDHHGYIPRMQAAMAALGRPAGSLEILIVQMVRLMERGELARMSKRRGQIIPMDDLVAEVGRDAARFFFLMRSCESHLDFDVDLAKHRTADNPVYYVQYAHARICSILRSASEAGAEPVGAPDLSRLVEPAEVALIRKLADLPGEIAQAAEVREPHRLPRYAVELATAFHKFYDTCRVLIDDGELRAARLALVDATRIVLANVLGLCGVAAPEKM